MEPLLEIIITPNAELIPFIKVFYEEAHFGSFLEENKSAYAQIEQEVGNSMPGTEFLQIVEHYYGVAGYPDIHGYCLTPSAQIIGGHGFGISVETPRGKSIYNVFGPFRSVDSTAQGFGFNDPSAIRNFSVHEFGHSFVNSHLEPPNYQDIVQAFYALYEPITKTGKMGYQDWACVAEHIIRACEVRVAYLSGRAQESERLQQDYVERFAFVHLPPIVEAMEDYERNREKYPSLADFVPDLMKVFGELAQVGK